MSESLYILYNWALGNLAFFIAYNHFATYRKTRLNGYEIGMRNRKTYKFLFVIFLLYSLFTFFGGDKTGYAKMVQEAGRFGFSYRLNMEDIYVWLGMIVNGNFFLWKLIVYGGALLLTHLSLRRLGVDNVVSLLFFVGMCLLSYGATRAVLAYAVYVFGLTYIRDGKPFHIALGWIIIGCSYFFHSSMIPIIAMTPLVYFRLKRNHIIILILLFPFILATFNSFIGNFLDQFMLFADDYNQEYLQDKGSWYMDDTRGGYEVAMSISYRLSDIIDLLLYFSIFLVCFPVYFKKRIPQQFSSYLLIAFFLVYMTLLFRFSTMTSNLFMYQRYLGMFPFFTFVLAVPIYNAYEDKSFLCKMIIVLLALKFNYTLLLSIYQGLVG